MSIIKIRMNNAQRVTFNTLILYIRMFLTVGISLYATRIVLNSLGEIDYGIYNIVGGVIGALSFLNGALSVSTQRYMSYNLGAGISKMQSKVFGNSFLLHLFLAILISLSLYLLEPFIFHSFLNINADRIPSAIIVYRFMSASIFFSIINVPFYATIISHENMLYISIVEIGRALLVLFFAFLLMEYNADRLIFYGFYMALFIFIEFIAFALYCFKKYKECTIKSLVLYDKSLQKELVSFMGWNTFGGFTSVSKNQGISIILNLFFGTVINAAYGIALQVSNQLGFFSQTMLKALNPQIMKSEGANNRERTIRLSILASKLGFFLISIFAIPVLFEIKSILLLWLKNVPENTEMFCTFVLISIMMNQSTIGLQSAVQAVGNIKKYMIFVAGNKLLILPVAYICLKIGLSPLSVMITYLFFESISSVLRVFLLHIQANMSIKLFVKDVYLKIIIPLITILISGFLLTQIKISPYRFLYTIPIMMILYSVSIYLFGMKKYEKEELFKIIKSVRKKINI